MLREEISELLGKVETLREEHPDEVVLEDATENLHLLLYIEELFQKGREKEEHHLSFEKKDSQEFPYHLLRNKLEELETLGYIESLTFAIGGNGFFRISDVYQFQQWIKQELEFAENRLREEGFLTADETEPELPEKSLDEILDIGEGRRVEFKETFLYNIHTEQPDTDLKEGAVKEISSLANTDGGLLVIGVSDDLDVNGLQRDFSLMDGSEDTFRERLESEITSHLPSDFASLSIRYEFREYEDKKVCLVIVESSPSPVFYDDDDFYVRSGSSKRPLDMEEAFRYIDHHWG